MKKKICVITGSRAEYGLLKTLIKLIQKDIDLSLQLVVTGTHLSPEFGYTIKEIKKDSSELWEIGASIYSINDNALKERVNIKKYIMEENDIKVSLGENVSLRKPIIINENVIVKLLSTRIKE